MWGGSADGGCSALVVGVLAGQFGIDCAVRIPHGAVLGQENKFFSPQGNGGASGQVFHGQVERFAGWRKTQWRKQYDGALVDDISDGVLIHLAHRSGVFVIDTDRKSVV